MGSLSFLEWLAIIGFILSVVPILSMKNKDIRLVIIRVGFLFHLVKFIAFVVLPVWGIFTLFMTIFHFDQIFGSIGLPNVIWVRLLLIGYTFGSVMRSIGYVVRSEPVRKFKEAFDETREAGEE